MLYEQNAMNNEINLFLENSQVEVTLRLVKLIETIILEWKVIGYLKKNMDKLIDCCRICEKKIRTLDLIEHSKFCEKLNHLKEQGQNYSSELIAEFENIKKNINSQFVNIVSM